MEVDDLSEECNIPGLVRVADAFFAAILYFLSPFPNE